VGKPGHQRSAGIYIGPDNIVYLTDRDDHVALKFTLDGRPLSILGDQGKYSDTGCEEDGALVPRAAGPFNKPTDVEVSTLKEKEGRRMTRGKVIDADDISLNHRIYGHAT
jgi:hypothetical protein